MRFGVLCLFLLVSACRSQALPVQPDLQPNLVTTAGGTWVTVSHIPFAMQSPHVEIGLRERSGQEVIAWFPAEEIRMPNQRTLQFQTPRFLEECADVRLTDGEREVIMVNRLCFRTLAFTANQSAHTMSVVDTKNNELFGPKGTMATGAAAEPVALAYNAGWIPGRTLYTLDGASGDMECHDASNFAPLDLDSGTTGVQNVLVLQNTETNPATPTAFDLAFYYYGDRALITHVTAGTDTGTNPTPGHLSWIAFDEAGVPTLQDVDSNGETTSAGAPTGITRMRPCVGDPPDCETGNNAYFYPLSIKIVNLATEVPEYEFQEGEPRPGEYAFISGVGYKDGENDRSAMVAVLDLNRWLYCDPALHRPNFCTNLDRYNCSLPDNYCNPNWWQTLQAEEGYANFKTLGAGTDGLTLGTTKHAMDFAADSWLDTTDLGPTLYLANQDEGAVYLFQYDSGSYDWVRVEDEYNDPITIATGPNPTGVRVQTVLDDTYVYITNSGADTVYAVDTASNSTAGYMDQADCDDTITHMPMAFDSRIASVGGGQNFGYSADANSGTVSVYDLPDMTMGESPDPCVIDLGSSSAPVDIVIQPVPDATEFFEQMLGMMIFSAPEDYDALDAQIEMIGDWKAIRRLELTPTSAQAIKAALNAFLNKIDQKVCKDKLKKQMRQAVKLYRAAYLHEHPGN